MHSSFEGYHDNGNCWWDKVKGAAAAGYGRCRQGSGAKAKRPSLGGEINRVGLANEYPYLIDAGDSHIKRNKPLATLIPLNQIVNACETRIVISCS
jgi:hypothetical protein